MDILLPQFSLTKSILKHTLETPPQKKLGEPNIHTINTRTIYRSNSAYQILTVCTCCITDNQKKKEFNFCLNFRDKLVSFGYLEIWPNGISD